MYKKISFILFVLIFSVVAIANDRSKEDESNTEPLITGVYNGHVFNGDDLDPVLTTIKVDNNGVLYGKYTIVEEESVVFGKLTNFRSEGKYTITVDWEDKYGSGVLRILFSANYRFFYGYWGKSESYTNFPWDGVRNEPQVQRRQIIDRVSRELRSGQS